MSALRQLDQILKDRIQERADRGELRGGGEVEMAIPYSLFGECLAEIQGQSLVTVPPRVIVGTCRPYFYYKNGKFYQGVK